MNKLSIVMVLSVALIVLGYLYFTLRQVGAVGPRFITAEQHEATLQTSINVVYRDIDDVKEDLSAIEERLTKIENQLGL